MIEAQLERQLLAAHSLNDLDQLISLYAQAADGREENGDREAACFYLTHAFVYALEAGSDQADHLQARLWKLGREEKPHSIPAPVDAGR